MQNIIITWQWVTQWGCLQIVTHLGQSSASQALSGHLIYLIIEYFTVGLFALDVANGVFRLLATGVAAGGLANGVAHGRALGVVALPGALGMALQVN